MLDVGDLEIHVAHACNLKCQSCSHYSDQGHKGVVSLEDADRWMSAWNRRLQVRTFSLVGGEPTIHPELTEFVRLARRRWPDSHLRLVTNGFFLHNHPDLPRVLQGDRKAHIFMSIHHDAPGYVDSLKPNYELLKAWQREYGLDVFYYRSYAHWRRTYRGSGAAMQPYDDRQPRRSWERCTAKGFYQLFEERIWKCSPLAYLRMQDAKHKLSDDWVPYLHYQPLEPRCSDADAKAFFAKEDEPYCTMCPAEPERFKLPIPLARVDKPSLRIVAA
jgi:hypothetical protein